MKSLISNRICGPIDAITTVSKQKSHAFEKGMAFFVYESHMANCQKLF